MKTYNMLARKELITQKVTSILILIAVVLSTMMTSVIGQSVGVLSAMRQQQAIAIGGNRYATFLQLKEEQVDVLYNDPRVSYVGLYIGTGSVKLNDILTIGLIEYLGDSAKGHPAQTKIKEGWLPENAMEIALPEDALKFLGFHGKIGDTISISAEVAVRHGVVSNAFAYNANFILTGITENNYMDYVTGMLLGIVGEGTAQQILPESHFYYRADICTTQKRNFQNTIDDLAEQLKLHELDTLYNVPYLEAMGIDYDKEAAGMDIILSDDGFPLMIAAGIMVCTLVLLAAGLVIYNILKIAVTKRIKQYGTLRAMGGEKGQLYIIVLSEVLFLCIIGIPVGVLFGVWSAKGILAMALHQFSPELFLASDTAQLDILIAQNSSGKGIFLIISALITLFFALAASVPAARYAAKVSPVVAMCGVNTTKIRRRKRAVKKVRNFESYYALLNLKRNYKRTIITILSLVMSITVFITLQGFVSLLDVSSRSPGTEHLGDYCIVNEMVGFSNDDLKKIQDSEQVETVAAKQFSMYQLDTQNRAIGIDVDYVFGQSGECFQVAGLNDVYLEEYFRKRLSKEQIEILKAGTGCIVRNPISLNIEGMELVWSNILTGSTLVIEGKELPVIGTLDGYDGYISVGNKGFTNGVQVIVNDSLYSELTGKEVYAELRPILKAEADREAFDRLLEELCDEVVGTTYISYEQTDQQLEESFEQINLLAWGLILFIGLIGILNIINTVYTSIHSRVSEIGMQRAIGMDVAGLYRIFLWEGAYYGIFAALIGGVLGYIFTVFVEAAANNEIQLISKVPVIPMLEATIVSVAVCLLATCVPLQKIAKMSIVDSIKMGE